MSTSKKGCRLCNLFLKKNNSNKKILGHPAQFILLWVLVILTGVLLEKSSVNWFNFPNTDCFITHSSGCVNPSHLTSYHSLAFWKYLSTATLPPILLFILCLPYPRYQFSQGHNSLRLTLLSFQTQHIYKASSFDFLCVPPHLFSKEEWLIYFPKKTETVDYL